MLTVLHYDFAGAATPTWLDWIFYWEAAWFTAVVPIVPPDVTYLGMTIREDTPGSVGFPVLFPGGTLAGTNGSGEYLKQATCIVSKLAQNGQRPAQGRIYMGGIVTEYLDGVGNWEAALLVILTAFWETHKSIAFGTGETAQMVIKASNPAAPNTVAYNPVTQLQAQAIPATLKRRKSGYGV